MTRGGRILFPLAFAVSRSLCAQPSDSIPEYLAKNRLTGLIRVWGSAQMRDLMAKWQRGFARYHPAFRFDNHLNGAVSAIAGVYTGVADIAVSREIWPAETMAFEQAAGHKPLAIEVATGSFDVPTKSDSLEVFVHAGNPISRLTLAQLDAVFGAEHLRGHQSIRTWGDLGLMGDWAGKPITGYGFKFDNAGALFFSDVVLQGSRSWNCNIKGFANVKAPDGTQLDAGQLILEALSSDRYGIAISNMHYRSPQVKALWLAGDDGGTYIEPTRENVRNRTYPLTRTVYIFVKRPVQAKVAEFLRYILSRQGQQDVVTEGAYLPLPAWAVREQVKQMASMEIMPR
jgi:phosphate transport system substrate-binding protein